MTHTLVCRRDIAANLGCKTNTKAPAEALAHATHAAREEHIRQADEQNLLLLLLCHFIRSPEDN
jgi:hypothetical protein